MRNCVSASGADDVGGAGDVAGAGDWMAATSVGVVCSIILSASSASSSSAVLVLNVSLTARTERM